jgi:hypothetical protein
MTPTGNEAELEQRALGAAERAQAWRQAQEVGWRQREAQEEEVEDQALAAKAAARLEEILGHSTTPTQWEVVRTQTRVNNKRLQMYARITVLGIEICAKADNPRFLYVSGRSDDALTLEGFGQALKRKRDREQGLWDSGN